MSQSPESTSSVVGKCLEIIKRPSTLIATGSVIIVSIVAYNTGRIWLQRNLPTWLETELNKTLNRRVEIGEISNLGLNRLTIEGVLIGETPTDSDHLSIDVIDIKYNILPLLIGRPLGANISIVNLDAYLAQDEPNKWLELELPPRKKGETTQSPLEKLPIKVDIGLEIDNGVIELQPLATSESVLIAVDGQGRYSKIKQQRLEYDLNTLIATGNLSITGNTILDNGQTQLQIKSDPLNLVPIFTLIPHNLLTLDTGEFQVNLDADIAAKENIEETRGQGRVSINNLQGRINSNQQTVTADLELIWEEQRIDLQQAQVNLGQLQGELTGGIDWQQGYQLQLNLNQINIAELAESLELELPIAITGQLNSQIQITGELDNPQLTGTLDNLTPINIDQITLSGLRSNFSADLNQVNIDNLTLEPTVGGKVELTAELDPTHQDWQKMPILANIRGELPLEKLIAPYYELPVEVSLDQFQTVGLIQGTLGNPSGKLQWLLSSGDPTIQGRGEILLQDQVINVYNTYININGGNLEANAIASLETQTWDAEIESERVTLTPFLPENLPTESIILNEAQIEIGGNFSLEKINDWSGLAKLKLEVDQGTINVDSQLEKGRLNNQLEAKRLQLYPEINLNQAQANLSLPIEAILNFNDITTETIEAITGDIAANVNINNQGELNTSTQINQGNWNTIINANQVKLSTFTELIPEPITAQVQLQGELKSFLGQNLIVPININQADISLGENYLNSQGKVQLSLSNNQPEIDLVDLNVNALVNLAEIPLETILNQVNLPVELKPSDVNLTGKANFTGNLLAKQVIKNPLDNLKLIGSLYLDNLHLNQRQFEPQLTGSVIIIPSENISLDLRGNRDIIAASFQPCTRDDCRLPFLPTGYQLRQGEESDAIIVSGIREGDLLVSEVKNFPLSILNLAPGESFGIPGIIDGIVSADLVIDLYSLATNGELNVAEPSLGYLQTKSLEAKFAYDSQASQAQLIDSSFKFKETEYNFQASLDLDSGEITGKLDLNQNNIADILQLLQWSDLDDVLRLINLPVYTNAANIQPDNLGNSQASIAEQVTLLWLTEQEIKTANQQIREGNFPLQLDINGQYTGQVLLDGTITNPQIRFNLEGKDWQWRTKPGILTIVEPLGLVWENQETLVLPELILAGNFSKGMLEIEPIRIQVEDTVINMQGNLSVANQKSEFYIENLSLDLIDEFVDLPLPLTGVINLNGTLTGSLNEPIVLGEVTILDTALNGQSLVPELKGEFSYDPLTTAEFKTTFPEIIQLEGSIPSPTAETSQGIATVDLTLTREVFKLLQVVSAGQLTWRDGEGTLNLNASLPLDWSEPLELIPLLEALEIRGNLSLDNALIDNRIIDSSLYLEGEVEFENQLIKIEDLTGSLADTRLSIVGVFPLVKPIGPHHRDVNNPLTIDIEEGNVNIENLYQGRIDGNIVLTGTALTPVIGGEVILTNGQVSIPESQQEEKSSDLAERLLGPTTEIESIVKIALSDFNVQLDNINLTQFSLYRFTFGGDLTLNGDLSRLQDLQADGIITLNRGEITFINTQFVLSRRQKSTLEFKGTQGLFNPDLDIYVETAIAESPDEARQSTINEIRDDIFAQRSNRIQVNIGIQGRANQIIPQLARDPAIACQLRPTRTPPLETDPLSEERLAQLATCVKLSSIAASGQSNNNLLNSPIVTLSSSPMRSKSEIIEILAGQFLGLADILQNSSGSELIELGVDQFVIGPLFRDSIFAVEQFVGKGGKRVGLNDLRVYPVIENVFQISNQSSIRLTYDYFFTSGQVRYEFGF